MQTTSATGQCSQGQVNMVRPEPHQKLCHFNSTFHTPGQNWAYSSDLLFWILKSATKPNSIALSLSSTQVHTVFNGQKKHLTIVFPLIIYIPFFPFYWAHIFFLLLIYYTPTPYELLLLSLMTEIYLRFTWSPYPFSDNQSTVPLEGSIFSFTSKRNTKMINYYLLQYFYSIKI